MGKPTIAIDFDGVLNDYTGWNGEEHLYDIRTGTKSFLAELSYNYRIVIYTALDPWRVECWLLKWGLSKYIEEVTQAKPIARCYLDDRAITFDGNFQTAYEAIKKFKPFWEKGDPKEGKLVSHEFKPGDIVCIKPTAPGPEGYTGKEWDECVGHVGVVLNWPKHSNGYIPVWMNRKHQVYIPASQLVDVS